MSHLPASLFSLPNRDRVEEIPPATLAYLGDAVYELHVRLHCLFPLRSARAYHHDVVSRVRAESQAKVLDRLDLTEIEANWVRRGRNAAGSPSRSLDPNIYQKASGFETLVGYLYVTNPNRLAEIFHQLSYEHETETEREVR